MIFSQPQINRCVVWLQRHGTTLLWGSITILLGSLVYWRTLSLYYATWPILPPQPPPAWAGALFELRWAVRGAAMLATIALVFVELSSALLTRLIGLTLRNKTTLVLLFGMLLVVGRSYLFMPGHLALGDANHDVLNAWAVRHWIESGNWFPYWSNYVGMGSPYFQFRFPLFSYIAGLFDLAIRDPFLSSKVLLFCCHAGMVFAMYGYVHYLTRSIWTGLFAGLVWCSAFYHYHHFVHLGRLVVALFPVLLPLQLHQLEKAISKRFPSRSGAVLALIIGIQFWVHTVFAAVSVGLLLTYFLIRVLVDNRFGIPAARFKKVLQTTAWIFLGVLVGSNRLLPVISEQELVLVGNLLEWPGFPITIGWEQVFSFEGSFLTSDWWGGYISPIILVVALIGSILAIMRGNRRVFGLIAWCVIAAYLSFGPRYWPFDIIFRNLPFGDLVYVIKVSGWYLVFFEFSLTALGAVALREIILRYHLLALTRWYLFPNRRVTEKRLVLVLGLSLSTQSIRMGMQANSQYPLDWTGLMPNRRAPLTWLKENGDRTSRVIDTVSAPAGASYEISMFSNQPSFFLDQLEWVEGLTSASLPHTLRSWLQHDLDIGAFSPKTIDLMYLLDVGYIISDTGEVEGFPAVYETGEYIVRTLNDHSPIVISCSLENVESDGIHNLIGSLDQGSRMLSAVPVIDISPDHSLPACSYPSIELLEYEVEPQYVRISYDLTTEAYAQLSYSWYPYVKVLIDGVPVDFFPTALDLIGLDLPAGKHQVEIIPYLSPVRVYTLVIGAMAVLFAIVVLVWNRRDRTISYPIARQSNLLSRKSNSDH